MFLGCSLHFLRPFLPPGQRAGRCSAPYADGRFERRWRTLSDRDLDALSTIGKPIPFAYHGYAWLIHRLTSRRTNRKNLHRRGYKEEGTTTTPSGLLVLTDLDRFHFISPA